MIFFKMKKENRFTIVYQAEIQVIGVILIQRLLYFHINLGNINELEMKKDLG